MYCATGYCYKEWASEYCSRSAKEAIGFVLILIKLCNVTKLGYTQSNIGLCIPTPPPTIRHPLQKIYVLKTHSHTAMCTQTLPSLFPYVLYTALKCIQYKKNCSVCYDECTCLHVSRVENFSFLFVYFLSQFSWPCKTLMGYFFLLVVFILPEKKKRQHTLTHTHTHIVVLSAFKIIIHIK